MSSHPQPLIFAPPRKSHTLILARGERVWRVNLRPWVAGTCATALALLILASVGSTALFLLSDDIASAFRAREAQTVSSYERRIADLRRELDRAASREFAERRTVEDQVGLVLHRQREIEMRFDRMEPLVSQARSSGLIPLDVPLPTDRPDEAASVLDAYGPVEADMGTAVFSDFDLRDERARPDWRATSSREAEGTAEQPIRSEAIDELERQIERLEQAQVEQLSSLAEAAERRSDEIDRILESAGLRGESGEQAMGGPFIPVSIINPFANEYERLSGALADLRRLQETTAGLPVAAPIAGARLSSNFGVRLDPFLRRPALHAGVDYPAPTGTSVVAAASGTVVKASRRGGYGLMVEIDHGSGHVTRYAHLSAIEVERGQSVEAGQAIGRVGSSGRSTGPHLHYEVRRGGKAVDPTTYIQAGERLGAIL